MRAWLSVLAAGRISIAAGRSLRSSMKIGLYSITYRGVWYRGGPVDVFSLVRLAKEQGWEGLELDAERPHAAPMDLSADDRKRLRDLAAELDLPLCAISPNCDLSSPVPVQREAMICYTRECIKLARDLGTPICKIFAAWRGITLYDGLATYDDTYGYNQYGYWKGERRQFVVEALRELANVAEDHGVILAMQNHGPDIVNRYEDVLSLIEEAGSSVLKACSTACGSMSKALASSSTVAGRSAANSRLSNSATRPARSRVVVSGSCSVARIAPPCYSHCRMSL